MKKSCNHSVGKNSEKLGALCAIAFSQSQTGVNKGRKEQGTGRKEKQPATKRLRAESKGQWVINKEKKSFIPCLVSYSLVLSKANKLYCSSFETFGTQNLKQRTVNQEP